MISDQRFSVWKTSKTKQNPLISVFKGQSFNNSALRTCYKNTRSNKTPNIDTNIKGSCCLDHTYIYTNILYMITVHSLFLFLELYKYIENSLTYKI